MVVTGLVLALEVPDLVVRVTLGFHAEMLPSDRA